MNYPKSKQKDISPAKDCCSNHLIVTDKVDLKNSVDGNVF